MSDQSHDKRQKKRIPLQLLVSYKVDGKVVDNFSFNLSSGGMFIETRAQLPVGSMIDLIFEIPMNSKEVHIKGEVMWQKTDGSPKGMGIEFKDFTDEKKAILAHAIDDLEQVS